MNISDLSGAVLQSGMALSSNERMRNALGGSSRNPLESLGGMFGGQKGGMQSGQPGGGLGDVFAGMLGGGGGLGGILGNVLNDAGRAVGGNQNFALGGAGGAGRRAFRGRREIHGRGVAPGDRGGYPGGKGIPGTAGCRIEAQPGSSPTHSGDGRAAAGLK